MRTPIRTSTTPPFPLLLTSCFFLILRSSPLFSGAFLRLNMFFPPLRCFFALAFPQLSPTLYFSVVLTPRTELLPPHICFFPDSSRFVDLPRYLSFPPFKHFYPFRSWSLFITDALCCFIFWAPLRSPWGLDTICGTGFLPASHTLVTTVFSSHVCYFICPYSAVQLRPVFMKRLSAFAA